MRFRVYGIPAPQGSKVARPVYAGSGPDRRPTGQINQVESSQAVGPWRDSVARAVLEQRGGRTFASGPVAMIINFYFPRPAYHFGSGRNAGQLKPSAPPYPIGRRNDIDKLLRAVMDALTTGGAWHDDGQAPVVMMGRFYADGVLPGCEIWLTRAPAAPTFYTEDGETRVEQMT